jgi:hypothetical protein
MNNVETESEWLVRSHLWIVAMVVIASLGTAVLL